MSIVQLASARGNGGPNTSIPIRQHLAPSHGGDAEWTTVRRQRRPAASRDKCPAPRVHSATSAVRNAIPRTIVDMAVQLNATLAIDLDTSPNVVLIRDPATRTMPNSIGLSFSFPALSRHSRVRETKISNMGRGIC